MGFERIIAEQKKEKQIERAKRIQNFKQGMFEIVTIVLITSGLILMLMSVYLFMVGFHNTYLSWDVLRISYFKNLTYENFTDQTMGGRIFTFDEGYMLGRIQEYMGLAMGIGGGLMFATGFAGMRFKEVRRVA